jgi:hypothetical protein
MPLPPHPPSFDHPKNMQFENGSVFGTVYDIGKENGKG